MKQHAITAEQIDSVFLIATDEPAQLIGTPPGKSKKDQTLSVFVLAGLANYLVKGEGGFDDGSARKMCEDVGCFDAGNHSKFMKETGNWLGGDKQKGWTLTVPGLKHAATVIKEMNSVT